MFGGRSGWVTQAVSVSVSHSVDSLGAALSRLLSPAASRFRSPASSFSSPFRLCAEASKLSALHPTLGCSRVRLLP